LGTFMKEHMMNLYVDAFTENIHMEVNYDTLMIVLIKVLKEFAFIVFPIMFVVLIISIAANLLQVGVLFTSEPLKLDLKKIDPISGAKRIFALRAIVELLKSLFKI